VGLTRSVQRHPLAAFFLIAFLVPWGLWSYLLATTPAGELLRSGPTPVFLIFAILGGFGPSLAAVLVAGISEGPGGVRSLLGGLARWRFGITWYGAALVLVPVITLLTLAVFSVLGRPLPLGDVAGRLGLGLSWPLFAALGEELGWRGFALPRLQARYSPLVSGLLVGVLWGFWHLPADYLGFGDQGWLFSLNFLLLGPCLLTGFSILMTWVYNRTGGSLLAMVLFHYSITFSGIVLAAQGLSARQSLAVNAASVAAIWVAVGLVLAFARADLFRRLHK
jgi:uncharacterized protein